MIELLKAALYGVAPGDALTVDGNNARASFIDKDVAVDKPVTIEGYTLVGVNAANYNLIQPSGLKANIEKRELLVTWNYNPAQPLIYDGTVQKPTVVARTANDNVGGWIFKPDLKFHLFTRSVQIVPIGLNRRRNHFKSMSFETRRLETERKPPAAREQIDHLFAGNDLRHEKI